MLSQLLLFNNAAWALGSGLLLVTLGIFFYFSKFSKTSLSLKALLAALFSLTVGIGFLFPSTPLGFRASIIYFAIAIGIIVVESRQLTPSFKRFILKEKTYWLDIIVAIWSIHSVLSIALFFTEPIPRLHGIFQGIEPYTTYPNTLAFCLLIIIPLNFWLLNKQKNKLLQVGLLANTTAFILTWSRSAMLAAIVGLAVYLICSFLSKKITKKQTVSIIAIILISITLAAGLNQLHAQIHANSNPELDLPTTIDITDRLLDQEVGADQSSDERIQFWSGSLKLIGAKPFLGHGPESFRQVYPNYQSELFASAPHPHNLVLKLAVENGLPAAFLLTFLMLVITYQLLKSQEYLLLATWIAVHVHLLLDLNIDAFLAFFLYLALIVFASLMTNKNSIRLSWAHYQNLNYAVIILGLVLSGSQMYQLNNWKNANQFANPNYELVSKITDSYPGFTPALELKARASQSELERLELYNQLTKLDGLNNLELHYQYLLTLEVVEPDIMTSRALHANYLKLIADYISKLNVNSHNTIASHNPAAAYAIINLLIAKTNEPEVLSDWQKLESEFQSVWTKEAEKFTALFPSTKLIITHD